MATCRVPALARARREAGATLVRDSDIWGDWQVYAHGE